MRYSIGQGKYGPVDDVITSSFSEFTDLLSLAASQPRDPADKDTAWWTAPFIRHPGATRRLVDDVESMAGWFGCDLDRGNIDIDRLRGKLLGLTWVAYTTASSSIDAMRWRVIYLLDREYDPADHIRLWRWANMRFEGLLDAATKNCNRLFFVPNKWHDEPPVFEFSYGRPVSVDSILAMVPAEVHPTLATHDLKPAPHGSPIISAHTIAQASSEPKGGRLIRLMARAATHHVLMGWDIAAIDLAAAALVASQQFSPGIVRENIVREAQRAIDWAKTHHQPMTALEKMRSRVLWERRRFNNK